MVASPFAPLLAAPQSRGFKIGACDWSIGKRCDPTALEVAKQLGLDGVQASMGGPEGNSLQFCNPELQKAYQAATRDTGLEVASLAIDAMWQGPLKSDPRAAVWLADSIDVCKTLGMAVSMICCFDVDPSDDAAGTDRFVERVKEIAPKAEKLGVIIGLENWLSAEDNMRIIERIGSPAVQVYYDVGNSTDKGRDVVKEIRTLGKLICELHFKDGKHLLGQGRIDFKKVREAIDDVGYRGWIHLESAAPHGVQVDYKSQGEYVRGLFPRSAAS